MTRSFKNAVSVILGVAIGISVVLVYREITTTRVCVYFTNDVHGHILPVSGTGGAAVLSNYLKGRKKPYLLLDAGDIFQGTPEGDLTNGEVCIRIMNELGYQAATVGNHEFDKGQERLKKFIDMANFPFLGANVIDTATKETVEWLKPYEIFEIKGVRIGVLGLTTSAMPFITMPEVRKGLEFADEAETAKKYLPEIRKKADVVIALTHIGLARKGEFRDDVYLAKNVPGIDAILGGHTHTRLYRPIYAGRTLIAQAGSYGNYVGKITIKMREHKLTGINYELVNLSVKKFGEDAEMKNDIAEFTKDITALMDKKVGVSVEKLGSNLSGRLEKNGELPLGDWQADVFRKMTGSDIAFQNIGGIRAAVPKGDVTYRDIYELSPFGNTIYTMMLTGKQVKDILEKSVSGRFGILQVSGLAFRYDLNRKEGERVVEISIGGSPLKPKKYYKAATNAFIAKGGDDFETFTKGGEITDTGMVDRDVEIQYLLKNPEIKAQIDGRIVNVTK